MEQSRDMKLTNQRFNLPFFLITRNRHKPGVSDKTRQLIRKQANLYFKDCSKGHLKNYDVVALNHKYIHNLNKIGSKSCGIKHQKFLRAISMDKSWQISPNRYRISVDPYYHKKGSKGAYWEKVHTIQSFNGNRSNGRFYNINNTLYRNKGITIPLNERERRAYSRFMVSNLISSYRNPNEPSATSYNPFRKGIWHEYR